MPLLIDASVADKAKIDPRTGPIQGVQPNANADPYVIATVMIDTICSSASS